MYYFQQLILNDDVSNNVEKMTESFSFFTGINIFEFKINY